MQRRWTWRPRERERAGSREVRRARAGGGLRVRVRRDVPSFGGSSRAAGRFDIAPHPRVCLARRLTVDGRRCLQRRWRWQRRGKKKKRRRGGGKGGQAAWRALPGLHLINRSRWIVLHFAAYSAARRAVGGLRVSSVSRVAAYHRRARAPAHHAKAPRRVRRCLPHPLHVSCRLHLSTRVPDADAYR